MGILAQIWFFSALYDKGGFTQRSIILGCDGLSVLQAIWGKRCSPTVSNFDIISAAQSALSIASGKGLTVTYHRYVPGHQDKYPTALDIWGTLNVRCDAAAVTLRQNHIRAKMLPSPRPLFGEGPILVIRGRWIIKDLIGVLRSQLSCFCMQPYFESRRVPSVGLSGVNTTSLHHAMSQLPVYRRLWISKMFYGFGPTGRNLQRRSHWTNSDCPRCGTHEDLRHIILCASDRILFGRSSPRNSPRRPSTPSSTPPCPATPRRIHFHETPSPADADGDVFHDAVETPPATDR